MRITKLVVLACLLVVGCGGAVNPTGNPRTSPPASTATPAQTPATDLAMCQLMPLGDVQARSPFQTPLAQAEPGTPDTMCEYRSADDAEEPVSVLLVVTEFAAQADANTSLANQRQAAVDSGIPVNDVSGLGDRAFSSGSDEVGVHAVIGNRLIDANMGGEWPDTTDDAKVAAGTELIRTIISRLP